MTDEQIRSQAAFVCKFCNYPIYLNDEYYKIKGNPGTYCEYCVEMKRVDEEDLPYYLNELEDDGRRHEERDELEGIS